MDSRAIASLNQAQGCVCDTTATHISQTPTSLHTRLSASNPFHSLPHPPTRRIAISMASVTDGIHKAAAEALQAIGDVKWNIACTEIAPPHLTDLEDPLDTIRMRVNWLREIKEEEWNTLWKPMPMHAQETLNAIAETCNDLVKSCWTTKEDGELFLRIRVLISGWEKRRVFAHRQSLDVWQHSLDLINGTAKSYVQAPKTKAFDILPLNNSSTDAVISKVRYQATNQAAVQHPRGIPQGIPRPLRRQTGLPDPSLQCLFAAHISKPQDPRRGRSAGRCRLRRIPDQRNPPASRR